MTSARHVLSGAVPALLALLEPSAAPAIPSVRRIANRILNAAADAGFPELVEIAERLGRASDGGEIRELAGALDRAWRARDDDSVEPTTILIVEDDRLTARVLADQLEATGRSVVVARRASEAEILLREQPISLVLLDLVLPDGDGRDLLSRIRMSDATRAMPILVITGRQEIPTQAECFALGADGLIVKPAPTALLQTMVAALLHHAAERRLEGRNDRLTGLVNRVAFMDALQRAASMVRRRDMPLALAMIDLDHFKNVNDRFGHAVGDQVLQQSARTIAETLRISDVVARWGGEEFCAFFPDTDVAGAMHALQKALEAVRKLQFDVPDHPAFGVTFSAGLTLVAGRDAIDRALERADQLLYGAKTAGRNRILSEDHGGSPPRPAILFVEDDDAVAAMVVQVLTNEGYDVSHYSDGESARAAIAEGDFVLALLDVNLPGTSGFHLVSAIRSRKHLARMPVILLTASEEEADVVRGFELGINDYITKPFYKSELLARIGRLLGR